MVGSFGYINAILCTDEVGNPKSCLGMFHVRFPLMASVFYGDGKLKAAPYVQADRSFPLNYTPGNILALWTDGHIKLEHVGNSGSSLFNWAPMFTELYFKAK